MKIGTDSSTKASLAVRFYPATATDKSRMVRKRPYQKISCNVRFTRVLPLAFLALSLGSIFQVTRHTSRIMMETTTLSQTAIDLPRRELNSQTIRLPPPMRESISEKVNGRENEQNIASPNISKGNKQSFVQQNYTVQTIRVLVPILNRTETKPNETESPQSEGPPDVGKNASLGLAQKNDTTDDEKAPVYRYKLALVRLLGNPIPPYQDKDETLRNLDFLLEHEPKFETTVDKHWILNRIADEEFLQQITKRLHRHKQTFSVLPFEIQEYDPKPYRFLDASRKILGENWKESEVDLLRSRPFWKSLSDQNSTEKAEKVKTRYIDELYMDKTLYVANRNNARNFAMQLYTHPKKKKIAKFVIDYVLPWDGDCFLSQSAHDSLHLDLERHNDELQQRITVARRRLRREMRADDDVEDRLETDDDFIDNEISKLMDVYTLNDVLNQPIKYFHTPMERIRENNEATVNDKHSPLAGEILPQIVLHRTAKARFDRNGVNHICMLQKLQIKGSWIKPNTTYPRPTDYNYHPCNFGDEDLFPSLGNKDSDKDGDSLTSSQNDDSGAPAVGWVTGLSNPGSVRGVPQRDRLVSFYRNLDARAVNEIHYKIDGDSKSGGSSLPYLFYDEEILKKEAMAYQKAKKDGLPPSFYNLVPKLVDAADSLLRRGTYKKPPNFPKFIMKSQSDTTVLGLAYQLTGEVKYAKLAAEMVRSWFLNHDTRLKPKQKWGGNIYTTDRPNESIQRPQRVRRAFEDVSALGLAYDSTGDAKFAKKAAENVRFWFLDPDTRLDASLKENVRMGYWPDLFDGSVLKPQIHITDFEDVAALGAAYELTGDIKFVKQAAENVRSWFWNPDAQRSSILDFNNIAAFINATTEIGISGQKAEDSISKFDFKDVYFFLDGVKMIQRSGQLSGSEVLGIQNWFRYYLDYLVTRKAAYYDNYYHGVYYDIQLISMAAFTGNLRLAVQIAHESASRLIGQIYEFEKAVKNTTGHCGDDLVHTLQGWMTLARMVSKFGIDLWKEMPLKRYTHEKSVAEKDQPVLCRAPEFAILLSQDREACSDKKIGASPRWLPIHWTAQHWDCPSPWKMKEDNLNHYEAEPMYGASLTDGYDHDIAPFWNLGLA